MREGLWLLQSKGNLFLFIKSYQRTLQRKHPTLQTFLHKYLKGNDHNSLYFAQKYVWGICP